MAIIRELIQSLLVPIVKDQVSFLILAHVGPIGVTMLVVPGVVANARLPCQGPSLHVRITATATCVPMVLRLCEHGAFRPVLITTKSAGSRVRAGKLLKLLLGCGRLVQISLTLLLECSLVLAHFPLELLLPSRLVAVLIEQFGVGNPISLIIPSWSISPHVVCGLLQGGSARLQGARIIPKLGEHRRLFGSVRGHVLLQLDSFPGTLGQHAELSIATLRAGIS
mmetsp:Transcript_40087/g.62596  ORF Transcript_40087/g.62596 Transcript_40087/m.62596 type:complete len:224 (+) Transcript_40087:623-1294(+)